jgi:hypothetical protein
MRWSRRDRSRISSPSPYYSRYGAGLTRLFNAYYLFVCRTKSMGMG